MLKKWRQAQSQKAKLKICFDSVIWLTLPLALSPLHYAHAYLDPGTGSYVIQIVVGAIFGAAYALRGVIGTVTNRFRKKPTEDEQDA